MININNLDFLFATNRKTGKKYLLKEYCKTKKIDESFLKMTKDKYLFTYGLIPTQLNFYNEILKPILEVVTDELTNKIVIDVTSTRVLTELLLYKLTFNTEYFVKNFITRDENHDYKIDFGALTYHLSDSRCSFHNFLLKKMDYNSDDKIKKQSLLDIISKENSNSSFNLLDRIINHLKGYKNNMYNYIHTGHDYLKSISSSFVIDNMNALDPKIIHEYYKKLLFNFTYDRVSNNKIADNYINKSNNIISTNDYQNIKINSIPDIIETLANSDNKNLYRFSIDYQKNRSNSIKNQLKSITDDNLIYNLIKKSIEKYPDLFDDYYYITKDTIFSNIDILNVVKDPFIKEIFNHKTFNETIFSRLNLLKQNFQNCDRTIILKYLHKMDFLASLFKNNPIIHNINKEFTIKLDETVVHKDIMNDLIKMYSNKNSKDDFYLTIQLNFEYITSFSPFTQLVTNIFNKIDISLNNIKIDYQIIKKDELYTRIIHEGNFIENFQKIFNIKDQNSSIFDNTDSEISKITLHIESLNPSDFINKKANKYNIYKNNLESFQSNYYISNLIISFIKSFRNTNFNFNINEIHSLFNNHKFIDNSVKLSLFEYINDQVSKNLLAYSNIVNIGPHNTKNRIEFNEYLFNTNYNNIYVDGSLKHVSIYDFFKHEIDKIDFYYPTNSYKHIKFFSKQTFCRLREIENPLELTTSIGFRDIYNKKMNEKALISDYLFNNSNKLTPSSSYKFLKFLKKRHQRCYFNKNNKEKLNNLNILGFGNDIYKQLTKNLTKKSDILTGNFLDYTMNHLDHITTHWIKPTYDMQYLINGYELDTLFVKICSILNKNDYKILSSNDIFNAFFASSLYDLTVNFTLEYLKYKNIDQWSFDRIKDILTTT